MELEAYITQAFTGASLLSQILIGVLCQVFTSSDDFPQIFYKFSLGLKAFSRFFLESKAFLQSLTEDFCLPS